MVGRVEISTLASCSKIEWRSKELRASFLSGLESAELGQNLGLVL